jgi:hypothetical protein
MHDFLEFVHEVCSHLEHLVTSLWDRRHHRQEANDAAESAAAHAVGRSDLSKDILGSSRLL